MKPKGHIVFIVSLVALLGAVGAFTSRYNSLCVARSVNDLATGKVLVMNGVRENDQVLLKLHQIERRSVPDIGLFGNHVTQMMRQEDVDAVVGPGLNFYNYTVPHVTVEEMPVLLTYLARENKLPRVVLLGVISPDHGGGIHFLGYQWKLHNSIYTATALSNPRMALGTFFLWFNEHIDFQSVLYAIGNALFGRCEHGPDIVAEDADPGTVEAAPAGPLEQMLPASIAHLLKPKAREGHLIGWRRDGSFHSFAATKPIIPAQPEATTVLTPNDSAKIAAALRQQAQVVKGAGSIPILVKIPRYQETQDKSGHQVVGAALSDVARDVAVIDIAGNEPSYFAGDAAHPGSRFYREALTKMVERRLLKSSGAPAQQRP